MWHPLNGILQEYLIIYPPLPRIKFDYFQIPWHYMIPTGLLLSQDYNINSIRYTVIYMLTHTDTSTQYHIPLPHTHTHTLLCETNEKNKKGWRQTTRRLGQVAMMVK